MARKSDARHQNVDPTGDPVLDLLACSLKIALRDADHEDGPTAAEARQFITETLSPHALAQLRELRLISW